jgi:Ca2+-binding EF-hand superfamily protein
MRITRTIVLPAAAFALMSAPAYAADERQSDPPNFNQMDKNDDGALTRSEAAAHKRLTAHFDQVDDNKDGRLTRAEYLQIMARQDLYTLRENLAEFLDPDDKAPLAVKSQSSGSQSASAGASSRSEKGQMPAMAASPQLVRNVQNVLQEHGVDPGPTDGIWGPRTHQAVTEFQDKQRLQGNGQLNAQTLTALGLASQGESASTGASGEQSLFKKADKDNNGYVSRAEFESMPKTEN